MKRHELHQDGEGHDHYKNVKSSEDHEVNEDYDDHGIWRATRTIEIKYNLKMKIQIKLIFSLKLFLVPIFILIILSILILFYILI